MARNGAYNIFCFNIVYPEFVQDCTRRANSHANVARGTASERRLAQRSTFA